MDDWRNPFLGVAVALAIVLVIGGLGLLAQALVGLFTPG